MKHYFFEFSTMNEAVAFIDGARTFGSKNIFDISGPHQPLNADGSFADYFTVSVMAYAYPV